MKQKRSVEGLRQNAQKKRQQAIERTEEAIKQLIKEGRNVNFKTVSEAGQVSTAWLYREPDIKARIEQLREQVQGKKQKTAPQKASDASKDSIIATLKRRIKDLEQQNKDLNRQNEVFAGQVLRVRELEQQIKRLGAENTALRGSSGSSSNKPVEAASETEVKLKELGVELNSTIRRLLQDAPSDAVTLALESLREAIFQDRANNPSGFFVSAVSDRWKPNEVYEQKERRAVFNEWWNLARPAGIVSASMEIDGIQCVLTADDAWIPFEEMLAQHSLDELRSRISPRHG
ncbi:DUF6262 family protein [Trichocoleus sp. Lan]|uniref:DUF6262 family protein n=1 Tax=Trichocoleus sp. Lan TaxID=2933927 RepID=UPI003297E59D